MLLCLGEGCEALGLHAGCELSNPMALLRSYCNSYILFFLHWFCCKYVRLEYRPKYGYTDLRCAEGHCCTSPLMKVEGSGRATYYCQDHAKAQTFHTISWQPITFNRQYRSFLHIFSPLLIHEHEQLKGTLIPHARPCR